MANTMTSEKLDDQEIEELGKNSGTPTSCKCPRQYPAEWDGKDIDLGGRCTHIMSIPMFMHMPIAYDTYINKQDTELANLEIEETWPNFTLTKTGGFRGQLIRLLEPNQSPSRRIQYLPSPFNVRVEIHPGDVGGIQRPLRAMSLDLLEEKKRPKELYLCHLTCAICADERGGQKIMLLRRWLSKN